MVTPVMSTAHVLLCLVFSTIMTDNGVVMTWWYQPKVKVMITHTPMFAIQCCHDRQHDDVVTLIWVNHLLECLAFHTFLNGLLLLCLLQNVVVKDNIIVIIWSNQPELVALIVCNIILLWHIPWLCWSGHTFLEKQIIGWWLSGHQAKFVPCSFVCHTTLSWQIAWQ